MKELDDKIKELLSQPMKLDFIPEYKANLKEISRWTYEKLRMEGEFGKLTPFQETVNTYLKNRAEELGIKVK